MYTIGFDANLELHQNFDQDITCNLVSYQDLAKLIDDFSSNKISMVFIPAATLPYFKVPYQVLAQATLGSAREVKMCSYLCSLDETNLRDISHKTVGRVNPYCTTSYWALIIYMMKKQPKKTKLLFEDTGSFENLLNKTVSGELPYSMIWDAVLEKYPESAKKLHRLLKYDDLPTPVIIGKEGISEAFIKQLQNVHSNDPKWFFSGFTYPNKVLIKNFEKEMLQAKPLK